MQSKVTWKQGMSFEGSAGSGFVVPLGTDPSVGGANDGFRPLQLVAVGLAGCTAMDVISILTKKRQDVQAFEVSVDAEQQEQHPHVFTSAVITYRVTGRNVDEAALLRAIELSVTKYCPVQAMLSRAFPMTMHYEICDEDGKLVVQGIWEPVPVE